MTTNLDRVGKRQWRTDHRDLLEFVRRSPRNQVEITDNGRVDGRLVNPDWANTLTAVGDDAFDGRDGELYALLSQRMHDGPVVLELTEAQAALVVAVFERFGRMFEHEVNGELVRIMGRGHAKDLDQFRAHIADQQHA